LGKSEIYKFIKNKMKKLIVKLVFIFLLIFNFFVFSGDSSVSNSEPNFNTIIKDIKGKAVYDPNSL
jgi:predicted negative regulator of RcsB-dependent stress response